MTDATAHRLLNELLGPHPAARDAAQLQLRADPILLAALHPYLLARLADDPADRLRPALLIRELYRDNGPLLRLAVEALQSDAPDDDVREAVLELTTLAIPKLIIECAFARPALFSLMFERSPRWVTRLLISEGRPGILTLRLFVAELPDPLLQQVAAVIADEAITSPHDLSPLIRPLSAVRLRPNARFEIGVALWRLTWTVDPEFVTYLLEARAGWYQPQLLQSVVLDMLAVEPKLDETVSRLLEPSSSVTRARLWIATVVRRVLGLGARGVKLLLAVDPDCGDGYLPFRAELLTAAAESEWHCRAFLPVALRVLESPSLHLPGNDAVDGLCAACRVIAAAGAGKDETVPKLLQLACEPPNFVAEVTAALAGIGPERIVARQALKNRVEWLARSEKVGEPAAHTSDQVRAFVGLLAQGKPDWLPPLLTDAAVGERVRGRVADLFVAVSEERRQDLIETLLPCLFDERVEVRAEAANWLVIIEPRPERLWPWLVVGTTIPQQNVPLAEGYLLLASVRETVTVELAALVTDNNPTIALNANLAMSLLRVAA